MLQEVDILEYRDGAAWKSLSGHCCTSLEEAEAYVATLDPKGQSLRIKAPALEEG